MYPKPNAMSTKFNNKSLCPQKDDRTLFNFESESTYWQLSLQPLRVLKVCSDIIRNRWSFSHSLALTHPKSIIFCFLSTLFSRAGDVDTSEKSLVRGICKGKAAAHKTAFHIPLKRTQWGFLREGKRETMCVWRYGQPTWSGQWNAHKNTVWWSFSCT